MTRVDFYHDAADLLQTAARIAGKAFGQGHKVVVLIPDDERVTGLDRLLWMHPSMSFVPHCRADSPLAPMTPVLLATRLDAAVGDDVLINLGTSVPPEFSRFARVVEIVGLDDADRVPGRERFRFYRDRGYELHRHALGPGARNE